MMAEEPIPDFITQVKNPNDSSQTVVVAEVEKQPTTTTTTTTTTQAKPKKAWRFFLCCGRGGVGVDDDASSTTTASDGVVNSKGHSTELGKIAINTGGAKVGDSGGDEDANEHDKYGINSPRSSGKFMTGQAPHNDHLLPPQKDNKKGMKCLVLDLDETLVHSSFQQVPCDFIVPVKIEDKTYKVYVAKRPHVDQFLKRCGELYEIVIFTASLAQYADPVVDLLDVHKVVDWRLFRESSTPYKGAYVKDMGRMGRDISQIIIIDNSPHSYLFNRDNAFPCETWYSEQNDHELLDFIPFLEQLAAPEVTDVRKTLREMNISPLEADEDGLQTQDEEEEDDEDEGSQYSETDSMGSENTGTSEYSQSYQQQKQGEQKT